VKTAPGRSESPLPSGSATTESPPRRRWAFLNSSPKTYLVLVLVFAVLWAIIAIPPFFNPEHTIRVCGRGGACSDFPSSAFVPGEIVMGAVFGAFAAVMLALAVKAYRRGS
jgi:ABC-type arginine transport system permease subunit